MTKDTAYKVSAEVLSEIDSDLDLMAGGAIAPLTNQGSEAAIARLDQARQLLVHECENIAQAKQIADFAKAAEAYAKAIKMGREVEILARGLQLRAERKIGEFLLQSPKNPGVKGRFAGGTQEVPPVIPTLKQLGFSKNFSSMAQRLAQLPEEDFVEFERGMRDASELRKLLKQPKLQRVENDFYPTPAPLIRLLISRCLDIQPKHRILEPCAGDGVFIRALDELGYSKVESADIDPQFDGCTFMDAADEEHWQQRDDSVDDLWAQDWVITNPPFNQSAQILDNAIRYSRLGVAALLRITFLEPCQDRAHLFNSGAMGLRYVMPVNPRIRFRSDTDKTDSTTVAWFVWMRGFTWEEIPGGNFYQPITNWR